jgi:uncharacterized membrane protein YvbJ
VFGGIVLYCQYCGKELEDEAKFCTECGKPVVIAEDNIKEQEEPAVNSTAESVKIPKVAYKDLYEDGFFFKGVRWYNKVGIAMLGLLIMIGCAFYTFCACYPEIWSEFLSL